MPPCLVRIGRAGAVLLLAVAFPSLHTAQAPRTLKGVVEGEGFARIKIALPEPEADAGSKDAAAELIQTVRDDLTFSGFFDVVDPALYRLVPAASAGSVPHDDWLGIGADAVTQARLTLRGDRIDLEARLHDNPSRTLLFARRYGGTKDLLRRVAHLLADDLVRHYTGRPGVALTRIAFVSKHGAGKEIYLMDYDGQRIRRLTTTGTINLSPVWSPDGNRLAFLSWRSRQPTIHIMDSDGKLVSVPTLGGELNAAPDWSPDGKKLVYSSDTDGNSEIYQVELATMKRTRLTRHGAIDTSPAFSPNGREIAFTSDRSGSPQIYVMDVDGLNVRRVSSEGSYNESAAWSPRGDRLAYSSRLDGRFDIVVLDLAGGSLTRLTRGEGNNENPRWSPDGRHIVFSSSRAGSYDIHVMAADGSNVRRLTRGGDSITPDWSR